MSNQACDRFGISQVHGGALASERVTVLGAPLLSVFSLHSFVCELSETCQESNSLFHSGKTFPKNK